MRKFTKNNVSKTSIKAFCLTILLGAVCSINTLAQTLSPTKYSIDVDLTITSGASIGFLFGAEDEGNLYMWQLNCANQPGKFLLRPHVRRSSGWSASDVDASAAVPDADKYNQHHMKIEVDGDTIITYLQGIKVDTRIETSRHGIYGRVGLRAYSGDNIPDREFGSMDNIEVKDGKGNRIYFNDFSTDASDFPNAELSAGQLVIKAGQEFAIKTGMWTQNYSIDVDITAINKTAGFVISAIDNDNLYMWQYNIESNPAKFRPHRRIGGNWGVIKEVATSITDADRGLEHHMKIDVKGTSIITYIDGVKIDSMVAEELGYGKVGVRMVKADEEGAFDNLVIKDGNGDITYRNDFNQDPPFNFAECTSIDGKLRFKDGIGEYQLLSKDAKDTIITPVADLSIGASANSVKTFDVESNTSWTITKKASWLTISPATGSTTGTITVTADANAIMLSRKDTILISGAGITKQVIVIQDAAAAMINASSTDLSLGATTNLVKTFDIESNVADWTIVKKASWLTVSPVTGSNNATITVTAETNTTTLSRKDTLVISGAGVTKTVVIIQFSATPDLTVTTTDLSVGAAVNLVKTFDVLSNVTDWTITKKASWLTISPVTGSNNATITVTAATNTTIISRKDTLVISGAGITKQVIVVQDAAVAALTVSATDLSVGAVAGLVKTFDVTSNVTNWTITKKASWLTLSAAAGSNNATITVTAAANTTIISRKDTLVISGAGITKQVIVVQDAAIAALTVSAANLSVGAAADLVKAFDVTSNVTNWTITKKASWLTITPATGSNNATITVTAAANTTVLSRKDTLVISGAGITKTVVVAQDASPDGIAGITSSFVVYPNPTNGIINVKTSEYKNVTNVQIFNLVGAVVKTTKLQHETSLINLSDLANGLYIVKITSGNNSITQKITKK